ncbi:MAG: Wzz/FepE/Etk N-terminal domain-containing protein [Acidobacteriota bacterium]
MASIRPRSFSEYAQMLWRRKLLFLAVAGATLIAAYIIISRLPDTYESKAAIVVTGKSDDRQAIADRVAAVRERLLSRQILENIAVRHLQPNAITNYALDAAINRLRKDTKVETFMRGDFPERLALTYRNTNPQVAKDVATELVAVFGSMNEALEKQFADESESLNAELNEVENSLSLLSQRRAVFRGSGGGRPKIDINALRAERAAAQSSIETLTDKQFALEREIAQQKQQIAEQQKLVKSAPSEARSSSSYGVLLVRKAELEAQIKDYTQQYTDKNPKVIQARAQLEEINRQLAQLSSDIQNSGSASSPEARELRTLQRELARLETELAITNRALERKQQAIASSPSAASIKTSAPIITTPAATDSSEPVVAGNSYERLKNRYDSLLRRQERLQNVRVTAAGLDPGLFQIVDMPTVPEIPTGPDRLKLLGLALVLALALGLAAVVAFEFPRLFSIHDDRDVEYYLGAPVIVLIPETLTSSERGRAKRLLAMRVVGMLLLAAVIIPVLVFILNNLRVFQLLASR